MGGPLFDDEWPAPAPGVLQPWVHGQCAASGHRGAGQSSGSSSRRPVWRWRPRDVDGRSALTSAAEAAREDRRVSERRPGVRRAGNEGGGVPRLRNGARQSRLREDGRGRRAPGADRGEAGTGSADDRPGIRARRTRAGRGARAPEGARDASDDRPRAGDRVRHLHDQGGSQRPRRRDRRPGQDEPLSLDASAMSARTTSFPMLTDRLSIGLLALTAVSGILDAVSFLALGHIFTANMTGNVVFLAFAAVGTPGISVARSITSLAAFLSGAAIGGYFFRGVAGPLRCPWLRVFAPRGAAVLFSAASAGF